MDIKKSIESRVNWIKNILQETGAKGIIYGNSGGKDCTLVSALCKMATDNVLGVIIPCGSAQNFGSDKSDAKIAGELYDIPQIEVDLTPVKEEFLKAIDDNFCDAYASEKTVRLANANINPRLRMSVLYAIGQMRGYLVAGTGNKDEITMGYFTKWGDGACDFNPIADLTVAEVYNFLRFLGAPNSIIEKKPSAGLYPGQTDELEMGISYDEVDKYLKGEEVSENSKKIIESAKAKNAHKLSMPKWYKDGDLN